MIFVDVLLIRASWTWVQCGGGKALFYSYFIAHTTLLVLSFVSIAHINRDKVVKYDK